jgi:hypothetical protein
MSRLARKRNEQDLAEKSKKRRRKAEATAAGKKPDYSVQFPKAFEQIHNWIADLDEAGYSDDVKRASKLAADATARSKEPNATGEHHATAARLHFIAHGVAKAHGHHELAQKHMDLVNKHREAHKQAQAAS